MFTVNTLHSEYTFVQMLALSLTLLSIFYMSLPQRNPTTHRRAFTILPPQDDINSDIIPSAQWVLELLTTPSSCLDPIIKVSSKETNWISISISNWKLAPNDAVWPRAEPSVDINHTSLCCDRFDRVGNGGIGFIGTIKPLWSREVAQWPLFHHWNLE